MKKQLIVFGIILVLLVVGLSGCLQEETKPIQGKVPEKVEENVEEKVQEKTGETKPEVEK